MDGAAEKPSPSVPSPATDTRSVVPVTRSRTKTSRVRFVSPGTRFEAELSNATYLPVLLMADCSESPIPSDPSLATDTRCVVQSTCRWKSAVVVLPWLICTFVAVWEIQPWLLAVIVSGLTLFGAQKAYVSCAGVVSVVENEVPSAWICTPCGRSALC